MKVSQIINERFSRSTTGIAFYDKMLHDPEFAKESGFDAYVVNIKPEQYIQASNAGLGVDTEQSRRDSGKVEHYAELMKRGTEFPMLMIQYCSDGSFTQEGLHRAYAALDIGEKSVPVLVVKELSENISESARDENILQNVADSIAVYMQDSSNTDRLTTSGVLLKDIVPSKTFGQLWNRLSNVRISYSSEDAADNGGYSLTFREIYIHPLLKKSRLVTTIVHELKHALNASQMRSSDKKKTIPRRDGSDLLGAKVGQAFLKRGRGTADTAVDADKPFNRYISRQSEISARVSQAAEYIRSELRILEDEHLTSAEISNIIKDAMQKFYLQDVFRIAGEDLSENPGYRKVFNKLFVFANHIRGKK